jgi:prefoldin alpha subunit
MAEDEQQLKEIYAQYQMIEKQMEQIHQNIEILEGQMAEIDATRVGLKELENVKEGNEILIPISNGIFAKGTIQDTKEVLVNVGADTVVARSMQEAREMLTRQSAEMKNLQIELMAMLENHSTKGQELQEQLMQLVK